MVENVLLDGGSSVNIMTKELWKWIGLPNPKPTSYTFWMAYQTNNKSVGLIKDLKIHIHGIPYIVMFTVMKNNVLNFNYSVLLGRPWLSNACVIQDWGNNLIVIEGNCTMRTITTTKHLDNNTKCLKVLLCYNIMEGVTNEEKEVLFAIKLNLFTLATITLPKLEIFSVVIFGTSPYKDLIFNFPHSKGQIRYFIYM